MILVTGCAGFIGFYLCLALCELGYNVVGVDNLNNYYNIELKKKRLNIINKKYPKIFNFYQLDLRDSRELVLLMSRFKIFKVYHLAAQAGVRYSLTNPEEYISNNINGFFNLIETCRQFEVKDFVFASTSGVYGSNSKLPFSEEQEAMEPENLYSATKRADELISISYSKNFNMKILSLRFFTVYGEYGRPDMGMYIFTDKIINDKPIPLFNNGQHSRSFTYIHDLIKIIIELHKSNSVVNLYEVLNIGNPSQHNLFEVVNIIANRLNKSFEVNHLDLQPGDLVDTQCDFTKTTKIIGKFNFTPLELGIFNFVDWFNKDGYKYAQK